MTAALAVAANHDVSIGASAVLTTLLASADTHAPITPFAERVLRVAAVSATHANAVDAEGRFPIEALAAMRYEGLLGAWIPRSLGGLGVSLPEIARACEVLGEHCASAGMIFATHQIQVASIVRHAGSSCYLATYLRSVARAQRLIAPVNSEMEVGTEIPLSKRAIADHDAEITFVKHATTIPYGMEADDILVTAGRSEAPSANNQVLMLLERGRYTLEQTSAHGALQYPGKRSRGFTLSASISRDAIVPAPLTTIASETMEPISHLLWSSLWQGMSSYGGELNVPSYSY